MVRSSGVAALMLVAVASAGFAAPPNRFALIVAVRTYEHAELNRPALAFPEDDGRALADLLKDAGYEVRLLLGRAATKKGMEAALADLRDKGAGDGAVLVGMFGHGVEYERAARDHSLRSISYFCPYDAAMRRCTSSRGDALFGRDGAPLVEPDPESLVSMTEVFAAIQLSKAANRIVVADCCRNDPTVARGGSFGSLIVPSDLPAGTGAIFACSKGERAFEDANSGHGALTRCLLDALRSLRGKRATVAAVGEAVEREVPRLVASISKGRSEQTPWYITVKTVDLMIDGPTASSASAPPRFPFDPAAATRYQAEFAERMHLEKAIPGENDADLVLIPPGEFEMGNESDAATLKRLYPYAVQSRFADASPRRPVRISQPVYLGRREVTRRQFARFVDSTNYRTEAECDHLGGFGWNASTHRLEGRDSQYNWRNVGFPQTDEDPVVNVSWSDAQAYVDWLNAAGRGRYRLPTEAEWEWAARAGGAGRYGSADDVEALAGIANLADAAFARAGGNELRNLRTLKRDDGAPFTAPVGKFAANGFGVHDAIGNVSEWCSDWYDAKAYSAGPGVDPQGPPVGEERVIRGGGWFSDAATGRVAYRNRSDPSTRLATLGFRLARTP